MGISDDGALLLEFILQNFVNANCFLDLKFNGRVLYFTYTLQSY
jgi:hypothetical protein